MSSTETQTITPGFTQLELHNSRGTIFRSVSTAEPRVCRPDEIPIIDISPLFGSKEDRQALALKVRDAATSTGFFYISNHGIDETVIQEAAKQCTL